MSSQLDNSHPHTHEINTKNTHTQITQISLSFCFFFFLKITAQQLLCLIEDLDLPQRDSTHNSTHTHTHTQHTNIFITAPKFQSHKTRGNYSL